MQATSLFYYYFMYTSDNAQYDLLMTERHDTGCFLTHGNLPFGANTPQSFVLFCASPVRLALVIVVCIFSFFKQNMIF